MGLDLAQAPHRRLNPLTGEWVQVSPQRERRPWQGRVDPADAPPRPAYDPSCYLCPGNQRAGGERNPAYTGTYVFDNDFPALLPDGSTGHTAPHPLLRARRAAGACRVACFSPRHDLTLAEMDPAGIGAAVDLWADQVSQLAARFEWVQVFENKGELMGCSNPHPHCQVWALDGLPTLPRAEDEHQRAYHQASGRPLLLDYAEVEGRAGVRVVDEAGGWLAAVPFWAVWPFEVVLLPLRPVGHLPELTAGERADLAAVLGRVLARCDNLFRSCFPYSMGWHGRPASGGDHWQLHGHLFPPLLRSATVRKFMVGYELLAEAQRDLTPEAAAERLRAQSPIHYRRGGGP